MIGTIDEDKSKVQCNASSYLYILVSNIARRCYFYFEGSYKITLKTWKDAWLCSLYLNDSEENYKYRKTYRESMTDDKAKC